MTITLPEKISAAPQVRRSEVAGITSQDFKPIVCNRPDSESVDQ